MNITRRWAFWRRVQYGTGFSIFLMLIIGVVYITSFYVSPTCFDGRQNNQERGVDCGGGCPHICAFDVTPPTVKWARSFRITDGQYNAVAYIENNNLTAAAPEVLYTFSLHDSQGLITQRTGTTILPPDSVYPIFEARIDTYGRVPTQTFLTIDEISHWVHATKGRGQFDVQSRSLTNINERPRLEADIYNTALVEAREVEIIATIFDAQGNALTASRTFITNFEPRESRTAIFTWPEPISKTLRSCDVPTDIIMAIDLSGSMNNDSDNPPEPVTSVLKAAKAFTERLQDGDQVALVTFATEATLRNVLTSNIQSISNYIQSLVIDPQEERGRTNIGDAIHLGGKEIISKRHNTEARKVMVLLTDGLATAPGEDPEQYALDAAYIVKKQDITIFTIGLGEGVDMDFVTQLASTPKNAFEALSVADINSIYRKITSEICEYGPAIIEIIPKTSAGFSNVH